MINIENVTKSFGDFKAIESVNLKINKSDIHGLLGSNGAGKTTLIRSLVGLYDIDEGAIYIDGEKINRDNHKLKSRIGVVSQHTNLDKELTVIENLKFAGKLYKLSSSEIAKRIEEITDLFGLSEVKNKPSNNISGGMKRKLMIAKALIHNPDFIILDEPTVGIDVTSRKEIWQLLMQLRDMEKTILLTTHYIEEAEYLCDMISLIENGRITTTNTVDNLIKEYGIYCVEYIIDHKIINKCFHTRKEAENYSNLLKVNSSIRETNLEDVFQNSIGQKVNINGIK